MRIFVATVLCLLGLTGGVMGGDLAGKPPQIEGAKVSTEENAKDIAFRAYAKKMNLEVLDTEGVRSPAIVTLGYDVPDFAKEGERVWEVRVLTIEGRLRAIIWIHPHSGNVHFVCGPWKAT